MYLHPEKVNNRLVFWRVKSRSAPDRAPKEWLNLKESPTMENRLTFAEKNAAECCLYRSPQLPYT